MQVIGGDRQFVNERVTPLPDPQNLLEEWKFLEAEGQLDIAGNIFFPSALNTLGIVEVKLIVYNLPCLRYR